MPWMAKKSGSYPVNNRKIDTKGFREGEIYDQNEALGKINLILVSRIGCRTKGLKPRNYLLVTTAAISVWCEDWIMVLEWVRMEKEGMR